MQQQMQLQEQQGFGNSRTTAKDVEDAYESSNDIVTVVNATHVLKEWNTTHALSSAHGHGLSMEFFREISFTNGSLVDDLTSLSSVYGAHSVINGIDAERIGEVEVRVNFADDVEGSLVAACYPPEVRAEMSAFMGFLSLPYALSLSPTPLPFLTP